MRVMVSGARIANCPPNVGGIVQKELDELKAEYHDLFLILGDASGVDSIAKNWAEINKVSHVVLYADWDGMGRSAGHRRNRQMILEGPDLLLAFPSEESKGTINAINQAEEFGIHVRRVSI